MILLRALIVACLFISACGSGAPEDQADDSFLGTGKADDLGVTEGSPEARGVLRLVNVASLDELDHDARLDSRAAKNIVSHRDGEDRIADTPDDDPFDTLAELDAIKYVGPRAFERLLVHALENDYVEEDRALRITTFNIRWYGLDGSFYGSYGSESRDETIRAFMDEHLSDSDVIIFQEIVDVELFLSEQAENLSCSTYESTSYKHQHVVLCTTSRYRLDPEQDDEDYAYEPLEDGNLRPGVHGRLHDLETGEDVAHLMGVHLKAKPDSTERRLEQARILTDRLDELASFDDGLPVIVFGDFNTHWADDTGLDTDDYVLMDRIFQDRDGIDVMHVDTPVTNTFRNKYNVGYKLDRLWLSSAVEVTDIQVEGPCNLDWETGEDFIVDHFDQVSDHCPVVADLRL